MREIVPIIDLERKLFLYLGIALIAIGVGPFGTYAALSLSQRATFWTLDVLGAMFIISVLQYVFYHAPLTRSLPSWMRFFGGIAIGALPAAAFINVLYVTVAAGVVIPSGFGILYAEVFLFSSILLLTEHLLWPAVFRHARRAAPEHPAPENPAPLMDRLPHNLRGGHIVSISMQDHYAQVVTTLGEHLLLIRMADAVDLLQGVPGAQIHRSHWVAADFAQELRKHGRKSELLLTDGRILPVSASYRDAAAALIPPITQQAP